MRLMRGNDLFPREKRRPARFNCSMHRRPPPRTRLPRDPRNGRAECHLAVRGPVVGPGLGGNTAHFSNIGGYSVFFILILQKTFFMDQAKCHKAWCPSCITGRKAYWRPSCTRGSSLTIIDSRASMRLTPYIFTRVLATLTPFFQYSPTGSLASFFQYSLTGDPFFSLSHFLFSSNTKFYHKILPLPRSHPMTLSGLISLRELISQDILLHPLPFN
jgi:hypothetical protein